jgi:ribosomal protein L28
MNRKRALRRWLPNLQPMVVQRNGSLVRIKACSRCIRTAEKV